MINSVALPKVAFRMPPMVGPVCAASASVASPHHSCQRNDADCCCDEDCDRRSACEVKADRDRHSQQQDVQPEVFALQRNFAHQPGASRSSTRFFDMGDIVADCFGHTPNAPTIRVPQFFHRSSIGKPASLSFCSHAGLASPSQSSASSRVRQGCRALGGLLTLAVGALSLEQFTGTCDFCRAGRDHLSLMALTLIAEQTGLFPRSRLPHRAKGRAATAATNHSGGRIGEL